MHPAHFCNSESVTIYHQPSTRRVRFTLRVSSAMNKRVSSVWDYLTCHSDQPFMACCLLTEVHDIDVNMLVSNSNWKPLIASHNSFRSALVHPPCDIVLQVGRGHPYRVFRLHSRVVEGDDTIFIRHYLYKTFDNLPGQMSWQLLVREMLPHVVLHAHYQYLVDADFHEQIHITFANQLNKYATQLTTPSKTLMRDFFVQVSNSLPRPAFVTWELSIPGVVLDEHQDGFKTIDEFFPRKQFQQGDFSISSLAEEDHDDDIEIVSCSFAPHVARQQLQHGNDGIVQNSDTSRNVQLTNCQHFTINF